MIYDCFLFFNEIELLKVRLEYLYDIVDYFVITESNITQSGTPKPLYYLENKNMFSRWSDKIIHNIVDDVPLDFSERTNDNVRNSILDICSKYTHYPHNVWRYENETYQRECILRPLYNKCNDEDLIMVSDLDEFPNKTIIKMLNPKTHINLHNSMRQYYINVVKGDDWLGTFCCKWSYLKTLTRGLNGLRMSKRNDGETYENSGWHFTFLGGVEKIKEKIKAYGHQEFNNEYVLSRIEYNVNNNLDIFDRHDAYFFDVSLDTIDPILVEIFKKYYPQSIKGFVTYL